MKPQQFSIEIAWRLDTPPLAPKATHAWPGAEPPTPPQAVLETRLQWVPGTLAVLEKAFAAKLGRAVGWEEAEGSAASPVKFAAQIYKRGVGCKRARDAAYATKKNSGAYNIEFNDDDALIQKVIAEPGALVVVDENVARLWPDRFRGLAIAELRCDEHHKILESVALLCEAAAKAKNPKRWILVGGGILTDVAAFAASLQQATIVMVPTTLLAMADASVGGKTGVNFPPFGKNQIGSFYFPERVFISTTWLKTLPARELLAGGAECMKHAFLAGDMALAGRLAAALKTRNLKGLAAELGRVVGIKADVVAKDPGESGVRATLNFGHTLGHALESLSQSRTTGTTTLLHGEAVSLGMVFALLLSRRTAGLAPGETQRMLSLLKDGDLVPSRATLAKALGVSRVDDSLFPKIASLVVHDKKNLRDTNNQSEWILLAAPGKVFQPSEDIWTRSVDNAKLKSIWTDFISQLA